MTRSVFDLLRMLGQGGQGGGLLGDDPFGLERPHEDAERQPWDEGGMGGGMGGAFGALAVPELDESRLAPTPSVARGSMFERMGAKPGGGKSEPAARRDPFRGEGAFEPVEALDADDEDALAPLPDARAPTLRDPTFRERMGEFGDRLRDPAMGDLSPTDLFSLSARLADAASDRWGTGPGSGAMIADALSETFDGARQRRRENEDDEYIRGRRGREETIEGRQDDAYAREQAELAALDTWLESLSEDERREAAADPEGALASFRERRTRRESAFTDAGPGAVYNPLTGEFTVYDQEARDLAEDAQRAQIANSRRRDPMASITGRTDVARLTQYQDAAISARTQAIPAFARVRASLQAAADRMGGPLRNRDSIALRRFTQTDQSGRTLLETLEADTIPMAIQATRGLQPISNFEFERALSSVPNGDMTYGAAMATLDRMEAEANRVLDLGQRAERYYEENGGLSRADASGRSFLDSLGDFDDGYEDDAVLADLPERGDYVGQTLENDDGERVTWNGSSWDAAGGEDAEPSFMDRLGAFGDRAGEIGRTIFDPEEGDTRTRRGGQEQIYTNGRWIDRPRGRAQPGRNR